MRRGYGSVVGLGRNTFWTPSGFLNDLRLPLTDAQVVGG